jgi:NitT/TauT family transport system permease protein
VKSRLLEIAVSIISIGIFIAIWQAITQLSTFYRLFIATPLETAQDFASVLSNPQVYLRIEDTFAVTTASFFVALVLGIIIGIVVASIHPLRAALSPYLTLANATPRSVFIPIFWVLFGFLTAYRFYFGLFSGIWPVLIGLMYSLETVDPQLVKVARSMGASRIQVYRRVVLPTLIPAILVAARLCWNLTLGAIVVAEEFAGDYGVGWLTVHYAQQFFVGVGPLYVVVLAVALIAMSINLVLLLIEKWFTRWNRTLGA